MPADTDYRGKPIKIVLVGCGAIAASHAAALNAVSRARCVALLDPVAGKADSLRRSLCPEASIISALEEAPGVAEAAIVAAPNAYHAGISKFLLQKGVHVLCEKPLALSPAEAEEAVSLAKKAGRIFACGLLRRFYKSTELVLKALSKELVGRPIRFEFREAVSSWPMNASQFDREISGGGVLIDMGPHAIDLASLWFGPAELDDYADDSEGNVEADAVIKLRCRARNADVAGSIHLSRSFPMVTGARIFCERGRIELDWMQHNGVSIIFENGAEPYATTASLPAENPFVSQLENFCGAIAGEEQLKAPANAAIPTLALIESCYKSRSARPQPWSRRVTPSGVSRIPFKKILVTGSSGKVGSRLVEMWAARQETDKLRCMIHTYGSAARILRFPLDVVEADLLDKASVRKAAQGCDAIVHLAVGERAGDETRVLLNVVSDLKIKRFVHISSAAVYGGRLPARIERLQEETPLFSVGEPYADQKAAAERAVLRQCGRALDALILRPHIVYGPGLRWSAELMKLIAEGEICILNDGGWCNLIYVDDLVDAIDCALQTQKGFGEPVFITDGTPIRWSEYIEAHARLLGAKLPRRNRSEVVQPKRNLRKWLADSVSPIGPVIRSREFRGFIMESPAMKATVWRAYLSLRERRAIRPYVKRMRAAETRMPEKKRNRFHKLWTWLQLSEARLQPTRARNLLGFRAATGFDEGLRLTAKWFACYHFIPEESPESFFRTPGEE